MAHLLKSHKKELLWLFFFLTMFILLRSINFRQYLTFFGWDQTEHAILALEAFQQKKLTLIGPRVSAVSFESRQIFLGPLMTYLMAFLLALSKWEPATASYLFMLFSGLMVFPLYFGVKTLINRRAAWIITIIYVFYPYYLTYTRFLWNPNFQFAMLPVLFWLMGRFKQKTTNWHFFLIAFWLGLMFQLHYQFVFSILAILAYYLIIKKIKWGHFGAFVGGFILAASPLILFELRNQFYLTQTLWFFWQNREKMQFLGNRDHYWLSQSFVLLLGFLAIISLWLKKLKPKVFNILLLLLSLVLFAMASQITFVKPTKGFWAPVDNWYYDTEIKIYETVKDYTQKHNITDYNLTNQMYDPLCMLQKYMMKRDGIAINFEDYWNEKYLFVVDRTGKKNYMDNPGYEVLYFRPFKLHKTWNINSSYQMHLVERLPKN